MTSSRDQLAHTPLINALYHPLVHEPPTQGTSHADTHAYDNPEQGSYCTHTYCIMYHTDVWLPFADGTQPSNSTGLATQNPNTEHAQALKAIDRKML